MSALNVLAIFIGVAGLVMIAESIEHVLIARSNSPRRRDRRTPVQATTTKTQETEG